MKEILKKHIIEHLGRSPERLDYVTDLFEEVSAKKNEVLIEVHEICKFCYFLVEGCLKVSTYNMNGDESTTDLSMKKPTINFITKI